MSRQPCTFNSGIRRAVCHYPHLARSRLPHRRLWTLLPQSLSLPLPRIPQQGPRPLHFGQLGPPLRPQQEPLRCLPLRPMLPRLRPQQELPQCLLLQPVLLRCPHPQQVLPHLLLQPVLPHLSLQPEPPQSLLLLRLQPG